MSRLRVAPIVEGHGEEKAIRILLTRLWGELLGGEYIDITRPIRRPRGLLVKEEELKKAVQLAATKLNNPAAAVDRKAILILLDAENDKPCELAPRLLHFAVDCRADLPISVVLANLEYETWFVASAESLADFLSVEPHQFITDPERSRSGKAWIEKHFKETKYSETVDQPSMTAKMNLATCRERSPSFDKLCREFERYLSSP